MLARPNRLTRGTDYRTVVRRGARCAGRTIVVHVKPAGPGTSPRFGFIVSKAVGGAVVRNTVRRRLKAICREVLADASPGYDVVIRALPASASATFAVLRTEARRCLRRRGVLTAEAVTGEGAER